MDGNFGFLNFDGLDDVQVLHLKEMIHPSNYVTEIEFPWDEYSEENLISKGNISSLNVHAPAFQSHVPLLNNHASGDSELQNAPPVSYTNGSSVSGAAPIMNDVRFHSPATVGEQIRTLQPAPQSFSNGQQTLQQNTCDQQATFSQHPQPFEGDFYPTTQQMPPSVSTFKLNPTVSCFIPQNMVIYPTQPRQPVNGPTQPQQPVNGPTQPQQPVNSPTQPQQPVNSPTQPQQPVNGPTQPQQPVNGPTQPQQPVNSPTQPQQPVNSPTQPQQPVNSPTQPQQPVNGPSQPQKPVNGLLTEANSAAASTVSGDRKIKESELLPEQSAPTNTSGKVTQNGLKQNVEPVELNVDALSVKDEAASPKAATTKAEEPVPQSKPSRRSWADIVSKGQKPAKVSFTKPAASNNEAVARNIKIEQEKEILLLAEDKMSFLLGKHLHEVKLDFRPVLLQPRGLINRRNWCYINACLQALLACSPFYTLLRDLPLGPGVDRGKSSTPVIDSMVKVMYEFSRYDTSQEELQLGPPFQPDFMYDMLSDLKSDCLKGQQEDAEEFLSFILNGMHEEMVKIIKNYEKKTNIKTEEVNGDVSDEGDDWQVIQVGSKNKGMVTRKVVEHRTPISDLLGGQIKSFLTTKAVKTASIQPFFTLQLDIQSDNVTSVSEALKEMTVKVPIQGYVCAKSKQEVEAFNHVALQKLPPILILHLKRFVYNKTGGCKKVMKKTDYPLVLDINKDIFSSEVKSENLHPYKLFAVMYHDGEEAVKGHYISDVYNHGSQTWIRCDDRSVTAVTEDQVLSHSPPRVPYLLFYQES